MWYNIVKEKQGGTNMFEIILTKGNEEKTVGTCPTLDMAREKRELLKSVYTDGLLTIEMSTDKGKKIFG